MTDGRDESHVDVDDRVRSQAIAGVVRVCPALIVTSWLVPPVWQSFDDQYCSSPDEIVRTCWDDPRSMWHEFDPVFLIDMAIFGSSVGPYEVLSTTGVSSICSFAHVDPSLADADADAEDEAEADPDDEADPEGEAAAEGVARGDDDDPADDAEAEVGEEPGSADAPPRPTTISTTTTTISSSTPMTIARRRQ